MNNVGQNIKYENEFFPISSTGVGFIFGLLRYSRSGPCIVPYVAEKKPYCTRSATYVYVLIQRKIIRFCKLRDRRGLSPNPFCTF
jgi:hypothetical protein